MAELRWGSHGAGGQAGGGTLAAGGRAGVRRVPRWKRCLDIGVVAGGLPVVVVLAALVACWVALVSRGGLIFRQVRLGRGGEPFTMYKFRSMRAGAQTAVHEGYVRQLLANNRSLAKLDLLGDERLIPGGRWLRMAGLDELPQLWNVLRGEMSLVGPRPCLPCEMDFYLTEGSGRFAVLPGLTGLWQVERTGRTTFKEMLEMDERYAREMSPLLDAWVLVRTPVALARQLVWLVRPVG